MRQPSIRLGGMTGGPRASALAIFVLACVCLLTSCANEENLRKSKGFYQEGIARLSSDQQQAYVSFQKAVKLNPETRKRTMA